MRAKHKSMTRPTKTKTIKALCRLGRPTLHVPSKAGGICSKLEQLYTLKAKIKQDVLGS